LSRGHLAAEFITTPRGRIFALAHFPDRFEGRCVLVVPPFAEEMNKCRRMVTELAQELVATGYAVIVPDFYGTGDSEGDFADTHCEQWLLDLSATEAWLQAKGWRIDALLGIRAGCLIAAQFAQRRGPVNKTVFWQPVIDGARAFEQFLRLRIAAAAMDGRKESIAELKQQFSSGIVVDVAGYPLSPALAQQLPKLKLDAPSLSALGRIHWFEVLRSAEASIPVPTANFLKQLDAGNVEATLKTMIGEPYWASAEIVVLPELLAATRSALIGQAA
jgi:exosortase A-associated hydrolase 2